MNVNFKTFTHKSEAELNAISQSPTSSSSSSTSLSRATLGTLETKSKPLVSASTSEKLKEEQKSHTRAASLLSIRETSISSNSGSLLNPTTHGVRARIRIFFQRNGVPLAVGTVVGVGADHVFIRKKSNDSSSSMNNNTDTDTDTTTIITTTTSSSRK